MLFKSKQSKKIKILGTIIATSFSAYLSSDALCLTSNNIDIHTDPEFSQQK
jgi:hypothetical protein